ncbi:hypothetical protein ACE193_15325 [Bernardetia sp. OM2101]|uniref:hypothetical protein n=1 Tax=Bernardetia sp. OM2101 TaxID=3344876 RepID=UPI0035CEF948
MKKVKIELEVSFCNDCPFASKQSRQVGLSTGSDYVVDWICQKIEKKITCSDIGEKVKIPNFCPFIENDPKNE